MKKFIAVVFVVLASLASFGKVTDSFIDALITHESNGDNNAVGDNGKAVGCLQIWKEVVDDVNRFSSRKFTYADRKNRAKSRQICRLYLTHYATKARLGHIPTNEDYARIWNGGPNGHKKTATIGYWNRLKAIL